VTTFFNTISLESAGGMSGGIFLYNGLRLVHPSQRITIVEKEKRERLVAEALSCLLGRAIEEIVGLPSGANAGLVVVRDGADESAPFPSLAR